MRNNFFGNMFGSIATSFGWERAKTDIGFIPKDGEGGVIRISGGEASWLGLQNPMMQYWAYCYCSPLAAVIDRLAEADMNGCIELLKDNGSEDYSKSETAKRIKKLFNRPNPLQTWEEFRGQQVVYKKIHGYCPVFVMTPSTFDPTYAVYMWNLNPRYARPIVNYDFSLYKDASKIDHWELTILGTAYTIPSDKIILLKDGQVDQADHTTGLPLSKVAGLDYAISNICAAMEADNVLLRKKGPLGFLSHDQKPDAVSGYVPMTAGQKKEIQNNLSEYGLTWSQFQYVITKIPVKWNPMSFNVKDLATKETIRSGIDMICDRFAYPAELMSGKNATYENRSSAEKYLYQNVVIPSSMRDMRQYNAYFNLSEFGIRINQDFDELPVLQEDSLRQGEAQKAKTDGLLLQFQNSIITLNKFRTELGIDTVEGDDIYFAEYKIKYNVQDEKAAPKGIGA